MKNSTLNVIGLISSAIIGFTSTFFFFNLFMENHKIYYIPLWLLICIGLPYIIARVVSKIIIRKLNKPE